MEHLQPSTTKEVEQFDVLLKDLLENIEEPSEFGRPSLNQRETLFCAIKKVYSNEFCRAKGLFNQANEKNLLKNLLTLTQYQNF